MGKFTKALSAILALSLFTGCTPTKKEQADGGDLPYRKLVVMYPFIAAEQKDKDLVLEEVNKYLKEKINAEISLEGIGFGAHAQKWPLMLQTNEQIDVLWLKGNDVIQNIPRKAFYELDELLPEYGKDVMSCFETEVLDAVKMNGSLYAIPTYKELAANNCLYYDIDVAERNGIDYSNISSFEDMDKALEKIKSNEPDITPMYIASGNYLPASYLTVDDEDMLRYEDIQGSMIVGGGSDTLLVLDTETDKIMLRYENPYLKKKYKYAHEWYQKGYINKDADTADGDTITATRWFTAGSGKPDTEASASATMGKPVGRGVATPIVMSGNTLTGSMLTIPRSSVDAERAMMFINLLYSDEYLLNLLQFGIEGKHYIKNENGTIRMPDGCEQRGDAGYYPATEWVIGNQFLNYLYETENPDKWQEYLDYNEQAAMAKSTGFIFDPQNVKTINAALTTVTDEYLRLIDSGKVDTDTALNEMLTRMKDVGADEVVAEAQKQYDEWKASKAQ